MNHHFKEKVVVITGANGGLGSAFARIFAAEGAQLVLAGRNPKALESMASALQGNAKIFQLDFPNPTSHAALYQFVIENFGKVDTVVNAIGMDVRKPLGDHTADEIQGLLDTNLRGAILLTHAFLPVMREQNDGMIIHVGGFADGKLAFPFYSVDVASRAGLYSFIESVNRELSLEKSNVRVGYFSPSPADTDAERPFHAIWREMGTKIFPPENIAQELLIMATKRDRVYIMGGFSTRWLAGLNSVAPALADSMLLRKYSHTLKKHLIEGNPPPRPVTASWMMWLGIALVVLSTLLYGGVFALPFLPVTTAAKLAATPLLILFGEVTFWIGGASLGKEVVTRYKKYLNPCNWFSKSAAN